MDRDALVALYEATGGPDWAHSDRWLDDAAPIDEWYGVETDERGHVVSLVLDDNQLSGELPPELGELTALERLGLNRNQLTGRIPDEIGNLRSLTRLGLNVNQLSGEIPRSLGKLAALDVLGLDSNELTGEIPVELCELTSLTRVWLNRNQLTGKIPRELSNLTSLERLWLNNNQLDGEIPIELCSIKSLTGLGLFGNSLTGEIPPEIGNLTALDILGLDGNELHGEIPSELGNLASLERLWLNNNQLTGTIPRSFGKLTALTRLWLGNNQLSGPVPHELAILPRLELLSLGGNPDIEGDRATWSVFDLGAHILPEDSRIELLRGSSYDERQPDDDPLAQSTPVTATLHLFAIAPIELYRASIVETVRTRFADDAAWKVDGDSELSRNVRDLMQRLSMAQAGPMYMTEEEIPSGDRVTIHTVFLETGICLVFHTTSTLTTGTLDARMYLRTRWALSLSDADPAWVEEQVPYNPESALYRAVWLWIYRRYRQRWWVDAIHDRAAGHSRRILSFAAELSDDADPAQELRSQGRSPVPDQAIDLIRTDELRVFAFNAWDESAVGSFSSDAEWREVGADQRVHRYREMWREHFPTTARALDILNAIDDETPPLDTRTADEFRGIYRDMLQTSANLRGLLGQSDLSATGLLDEGSFALVTRDIVAKMRSWDLRRVLNGIVKHRRVRDHQYPIESDWYDLADGDDRLLLLAREESLEVATASAGHINDIVAMEIALQSAWNKFERLSWNLDIILKDRDRGDIDESEALRQLSELALRVAGWRTRLSGWQRGALQHLRSASRLDENIEAFFKASEEYVRHEGLVRVEQQAGRERKFQRVVTIAGIALAAIVLGEITLSIAGDDGHERVEASVAVIVGFGALLICPWLVASTFDDWSRMWRSWGVLIGFAFLAAQVSGFISWAAQIDWLPSFYLFSDFWWPWPGLPLLGLSIGAGIGCLYRAREAARELRATWLAARDMLKAAGGSLGRLLRKALP